MTRFTSRLVLFAALAAAACDGDAVAPTAVQDGSMSFFVSSATSPTGNLGGIQAADELCDRLATAVGHGDRTWRAYLSADRDPTNGNRPTDAANRIGSGPWINARGVLVARDLRELHQRRGDATVFLTERGEPINGQWPGSPRPIEHDILTGSTTEGALMSGRTCEDWTSSSSSLQTQVGHSDGLGPGGSPAGSLSSWNSAHANQSCANTAPGGGAGRIYCFAQ
jgi:hypothetical protein